MTVDDVIDGLVRREGGYVDHPSDKGGPTKFGITAGTLGEWRGYGRQATRAEVQALTEREARLIYASRYINRPGFTAENVPHERLRVALIDEGVNAGPSVAVKHLQEAMGVPADGILGTVTIAALKTFLTDEGLLLQIVRLRCLRYARIVQADRSQAVFLAGWLSRSFEMLA